MALPSGYKRLEYIKSSGTQHINSLFTASGGKLRVLIDFSYTSVTSGQSIFGAQETSGIPYGLIPYTSEAGKSYFYVASSSKIANVSVSADVRNIWDLELYNGILTYTVSGTSKTASYSGTPNKNYPYFIFANNHGGTAKQFCSAKLYSCQLYDNGTLVRDYIPCQKPDGTIGLWDDVNSVFYGNAGTGTFTAGPIVVPMSEITELEYIQSSGTQFINAGFKPNQNTRVVMKMKSSQSTGNNVWLFGCQKSWSTNGYAVSTYTAEFGNNSTTTAFTIYDGVVHEVDFDCGTLKIDGLTVWTSSGTFQTEFDLYLAAINANGSASGFDGSIYSCQIYDNGTLIRDYIAVKLSDGTVGLYDKLHGLLYINVGTGTFTAGPVKEPPPAPATLQHLLAVRLAWSAVKGATSYNVYRDGTLLTSTTETTFIDLTAAENTEYTYAVSAIGSGGESAKTTLTVYTKAGYFLYKPYIESANFP